MELREKIRELIEKGELSQAELAKKLGKSEATISMWLKGAYKGDVQAVDEAAKKFLTFNAELQTVNKQEIPFVMTSIAKTIHTYAKLCQQDSEIGIVYGKSGLGKTTAITELAKKHHGVIVLEPDEDCGAKALISELYEKLGFSGNLKPIEMKREILKKLTNSNFLIIVDEGENLRTACFKALRKLHDKAHDTFGLMFVGTHRLYHNLIRLKGDFEYLTNRIGYRAALDNLSEDDAKNIVKTLISDDEIADYICKKSGGNARILTKVLKRALKLAKMNNTSVNTRIDTQCREMLIA
jgi:DNA transposition AAA+ family ATPase